MELYKHPVLTVVYHILSKLSILGDLIEDRRLPRQLENSTVKADFIQVDQNYVTGLQFKLASGPNEHDASVSLRFAPVRAGAPTAEGVLSWVNQKLPGQALHIEFTYDVVMAQRIGNSNHVPVADDLSQALIYLLALRDPKDPEFMHMGHAGRNGIRYKLEGAPATA